MNGTWKENISGYDRKGNRRKKQSRKHLLKDKLKPFIKKFGYKNIENSAIRYENKIEYISELPIVKKSGWVEEYIVEVSTIIGTEIVDNVIENIYSYSIKTAYLENGVWYDVYTNEIYLKVRIISFLAKKEKIFNKPKIIKNTFHRNKYMITDDVYIYNKPIPENYWHIYGFYSTKARKYAQKMVNHMDRQRVRAYIAKGNWESEIKTHSLSKSIAWEIY